MLDFRKMQAQGNDFVVINLKGGKVLPITEAKLAVVICDRRLGIGADGLVLIKDDPISDAMMLIFNSDGSRAGMCGSALRCVGWLLASKGKKNQLLINTDAGLKSVEVMREEMMVHANLGTPVILEKELELDGVSGSLVDVGNLHFVSWWDDLTGEPHLAHGPKIEKTEGYERGINSMYARMISPQEIELKIWENGVGPTLACGTGATATVKTGYALGLLEGQVCVHLPGGDVFLSQDSSGDLILSGQVNEVFTGSYLWKI